MPDEISTAWINFRGWTLRVRASEGQDSRLLVMIHGWTGDENSMWVFTRGFPKNYHIVAPRAPYATQPGGFSWRPLETSNFGQPTYDLFQPAAEELIHLLEAYRSEVQPAEQPIDIIGFSQGAVMVNLLGLLFPKKIRKMGVLSGFVPAGMDAIIAAQPLSGKRIFWAHGTQDETVTIDRARASIALLQQAGAEVQFCEDEVGHKLSARCLRGLENYLQD